MFAIEHHDVRVNGITLHYAAAGDPDAPLVMLLHGFPECWYSWRHQLPALAAAGYRAVAPDQRGFGRSDAPEPVEAYTLPHMVGDVVTLTRALGASRFAVVGHDWGAPVAWLTALLRPDLVRGVVGLSVAPPLPRQGDTPPLAVMDVLFQGRFYWNYFNRRGLADAEFAADPERTFRAFLYGASGDNPRNDPRPPQPLTQPDGTFLGSLDDTQRIPSWATEDDIAVFAAEYAKNGFTGGLNWYRNLDRNWELSAAWDRLPLRVPGLYVHGDRDLVMSFPGMDDVRGALPQAYPTLQPSLILPGCGHWTQQERPAEVNTALLDFLAGLQG
ncbi:alpha/beta fold hydrolase [Streptacidiphilus neutrinimicus]|uniref:alpha/beta fold hydrolase n=1 Tax=Streptacidiphilus neutrinimicus TaxID=105420 RepID=UPI000B245D2D|nr:alpha/beta hydrolase [Streptacidiphilus neutrinimicus]